ncbi:MAG: hypothetical protein ACRES4_02695, partial [Nevskiales bacterium]
MDQLGWEMTASNTSVDLSQNRFGLRFISHEAENLYRAWRNEQNVPVVRLTCAVGIPAWLLPPWLGTL